jgi:hypothetical protein
MPPPRSFGEGYERGRIISSLDLMIEYYYVLGAPLFIHVFRPLLTVFT